MVKRKWLIFIFHEGNGEKGGLKVGIQEQIFEAIDVITDEKLKRISFDQVIEGVIDSSQQNDDGSYYFLYQGLKLTAFPLENVKYEKGDVVYILTIGGDLSKKKVILTAKDKPGGQFIDIEEALRRVNSTGINYVENVETEFVLYSGTSERELIISPDLIIHSMSQSYIRIAADVESKLAATVGASYGIALGIRYSDGEIREYNLGMNEILGDVYNARGRHQSISPIYYGGVMSEILYAKIFIKGFPSSTTEYVKFSRVRIEFVEDAYYDMATNLPYKVEIYSTNGLAFKNRTISTRLIAMVFLGREDITDKIESSRFIWTRRSANPEADQQWNDPSNSKGVGVKYIDITTEDVHERATFTCTITRE